MPDLIEWKSTDDGILLSILVQPGARRNEVVGQHDSRLKIAVQQVAEDGKANRAVCELLAKQLKLAKSNVDCISGHTQRRKTIKLLGIREEDFRKWIEEAEEIRK